MGKNGAKFRRGTFSQTILKNSITREMRSAPGRHELKFRFDLLSRNLRDMLSIEEVSYVVYQRLYAVLLQEYARAFDKMNKREKKSWKETRK